MTPPRMVPQAPEPAETQRQAVPVRIQQPGRERPARIIRNEQEARLHMAEQSRHFLNLIEEARRQSTLADVVVSVRRAGGTAYRVLLPQLRRLEMLYEETARVPPGRAREIALEETAFLTGGYLGDALYARFTETPPYVSFVPREVLEVMTDAYGCLWRGQYIPDTNHLLMHPYVRSEGEMRLTIVHELLHYASWLGGGATEYRWAGNDGRPVQRNIPWLDEGLTELHAQQMLRGRGFGLDVVSYAPETIVGIYLQQIVGADILRRAYLSGDFQEAGRIVDSRLGAGSFERLAGYGRGAEALSFLEQRLDSARIDRSSWESDPVVVLARSRM
ncbi:MAG: hypothetical protein AB1529_08355 [Candidatus Micrarchaeota archaeon]